MSENTKELTTQQQRDLQEKKSRDTASQRFTQRVLAEFADASKGELRITQQQEALIRGYFLTIDKNLRDLEQRRGEKNDLPYRWENVNLPQLALDAVHAARLGLDMQQKNHLFAIPYKNAKTGKYDLTMMKGYNGIRYIAEKYAHDKPAAVTTEIVHERDEFTIIKKSALEPVESYTFNITHPFDRGEIIGGFVYYEYDDARKNKLLLMTIKEIEKRKPKYASAEFWGGEITAWENNKPIKQKTEGWFKEMVHKTLIREAYSEKNIALDPAKIDESFLHMKHREASLLGVDAEKEALERENRKELPGPVYIDDELDPDESGESEGLDA